MTEHAGEACEPLRRAFLIQQEASNARFDWPDIAPVFHKILEEIDEIRDALREGNDAAARRELGDLLFAAVNLSRFLGADPHSELDAANRRFVERFARMKAALERAGRCMEACSLDEMDEAWQRVKDAERATEFGA